MNSVTSIEAIILAVAVTALCMLSMWFGAYLGQKVRDGEKIEPPHPVEAFKEHIEKKAAEREHDKEQRKIDTIMRNIETYDGTSNGQEDVK